MYHAVFAWNIGLLIHGNDYRLAKIKLGHRGIERGNFALARFLACHIHTYLNQAVSLHEQCIPSHKVHLMAFILIFNQQAANRTGPHGGLRSTSYPLPGVTFTKSW